ncbi:DUF1264 domain-containing protein [Spirosoma endbachense]|uniref:DUF1264 domain-containing protein n=1 Tax=Spirosoma endbachense TaxID=2666025 RepID=A0A6P1WA00_9BACT|nr:DUF1264 domain-containing protein [Spirosoma endbachense]
MSIPDRSIRIVLQYIVSKKLFNAQPVAKKMRYSSHQYGVKRGSLFLIITEINMPDRSDLELLQQIN